MYSISKLIEIAKNEIGYLEKKSLKNLDDKTANAGDKNYTKYWRDLYPSYQGNAWCDCFVSWCFMKAFSETPANTLLCGGLYSFYTPTSASLYQKNGRWFTEPSIGDQIFFKNETRIFHTGIVVDVSETTITTVEGNTSGASGVVANGGGVRMKTYPIGASSIAGFGRPQYGTQTIPSAEYPMWIKSGNEWYYRVQVGQNAHGWRDINGHRYWFDDKGKMAKEWREIEGNWYYFQPESGKGINLAGALYVTDETGAQRIMEV